MTPVSPNTAAPLALHEHNSRREWLRVGGLGCLGLSLGHVLHPAAPAALPASGSFGKAFVILIFLGALPLALFVYVADRPRRRRNSMSVPEEMSSQSNTADSQSDQN